MPGVALMGSAHCAVAIVARADFSVAQHPVCSARRVGGGPARDRGESPRRACVFQYPAVAGGRATPSLICRYFGGTGSVRWPARDRIQVSKCIRSLFFQFPSLPASARQGRWQSPGHRFSTCSSAKGRQSDLVARLGDFRAAKKSPDARSRGRCKGKTISESLPVPGRGVCRRSTRLLVGRQSALSSETQRLAELPAALTLWAAFDPLRLCVQDRVEYRQTSGSATLTSPGLG